MKKATLLGAALGLAPMAAMAADLAPARTVVVAPPAFVQFNQWGGFYGGLSVGWHSGRSNGEFIFPQAGAGQAGFVGDVYRGDGYVAAQNRFDERLLECTAPCVRTDDTFALPVIPFGQRMNDRDGFVGTLNAGYNWQLGVFVLGVETDLSFLGGRNNSAFYGDARADYQFDIPQAGTERVSRQAERLRGVYDVDASMATSARMNWLSTARLRAGFAAGPFLMYATGGLAFGGVQMRANGYVNERFEETLALGPDLRAAVASPVVFGTPQTRLLVNSTTTWDARRSNNWELGWALGAGAEWQVSRGFSLKAEYLYYDLGDATLTATGFTTTTTRIGERAPVTTTRASTPVTIRQNLDGHIFRVGLNFGFPVPPRSAAPVVAAY